METINLNDTVTVKLNELGERIYTEHYNDIGLEVPKHDSVISLQLWDLAYLFGKHLYMGGKMPFESLTLAYRSCMETETPKTNPIKPCADIPMEDIRRGRANPPDISTALLSAQKLAKAGVIFYPIPALNEDDARSLHEECLARMDKLIERNKEN